MLLFILKLLPINHWPLLNNQPTTLQPSKFWHPLCANQAVWPSIWRTEGGVCLSINFENCRPIQTICAGVWLLGFALGAVLSQCYKKVGKPHPMAYLSQSLIQAKRNCLLWWAHSRKGGTILKENPTNLKWRCTPIILTWRASWPQSNWPNSRPGEERHWFSSTLKSILPKQRRSN